MTKMTTELHRLHESILATGTGTRHLFQPKLARMIDRMEAAGEPVPSDIRNLSDELTADAIEAQFDNMPV